MLKSLIRTALRAVDDAGVETVLTLAFVAQFAAYALPLHGVDPVRLLMLSEERAGETGTVLQMPAKPDAPRAGRTAPAREAKAGARATAARVTQKTRVARPDPVDEETGAAEVEQLRQSDAAVRITIIGPDGQPRTKVVRVSGSRDGMSAPARRPHD
jgi:hypothetical protein